MEHEVWKPITGYEHYQVSSLGRVRSPKKILKVQTLNNGYKCVRIYYNSKDAVFKAVHILVCEEFNGPKPFEGAQVLHRDDNKDNNTPGNVYWGTQKQNLQDQYNNGKIANAKLNWDKVREMRRLRKLGVTHRELVVQFEVSSAVVSNVCNNKAWIEPDPHPTIKASLSVGV